MAENSLTDALGKIMDGDTTANVGQTSLYTPPDPFAASLASINTAYSTPAPAAAPAANAYSAPAPASMREYRAGLGMGKDVWAAMRPKERQAVRGDYSALGGQPRATPGQTTPWQRLAPAVSPQSLWKSYEEYSAGNPGASAKSYTAYKESLPLIYQDLINYGISPEMVASGQAASLQRQFGQEVIPTDYNQAMSIYGTKRGGPSDQGTGLILRGSPEATTYNKYATPI